MSLSIGIVGLPNVGKSTLFNALTEKSVSAENFPFCTIDPSVGIVGVPDQRLTKLSTFSESEKTVPAAVEFVDIAGLVSGASRGEGLGNQFLANIRETDAIAQVVRIFDDTSIAHVSNTEVEPLDDIETINLELLLADMETVRKRTERIEKDVKRGDKQAIAEYALLEKLHAALEQSQLVSSLTLNEEEQRMLQHLHLLTAKPMLYVLNKQSGGHNLDERNDERYKRLMQFLEETNAQYVVVDAAIESELSQVHPDDREMFREEFGALDNGVNDLIREGFNLLDLISFFTTGKQETRAWMVPQGVTAPEAGAAIHSDFHDRFICADVIRWDTLLTAGSYAAARDAGHVRTEGKQYVVQDGDVMEFKI
jgi:hypothetical protein